MSITAVATITAPLFVLAGWLGTYFLRARKVLFCAIEAPRILNPKTRNHDTTLIVRHRDVELNQPVYVQSVYLRNDGNRDIVSSDFPNQAAIHPTPGYEILSARAAVDSGVELKHQELDPTKFEFHWNLLKVQEGFRLDFVMTTALEEAPKRPIVSDVIRLENVKVKYNNSLREMIRFFAFFWLILFLSYSAMIFAFSSSSPFTSKLAFDIGAEQSYAAISVSGSEVKICSIESSIFSTPDCKYVSLQNFSEFTELEKLKGVTGRSLLWEILFYLVLSIVIPIMVSLDKVGEFLTRFRRGL